MREAQNILDLDAIQPDWMGLIFYAKSPRFVSEQISATNAAKRIGVFVDEDMKVVKQKITDHNLDGVQLHGQEPPDYCQCLRDLNVLTIKAFSVDHAFDFTNVAPYEGHCDYYLFDTKGKLPGGTGESFDWSVLEAYVLGTPFVLSGGIGLDSIPSLRNFSHPLWAGIDLNSRFEDAPGLKNIEKIKTFNDAIRR